MMLDIIIVLLLIVLLVVDFFSSSSESVYFGGKNEIGGQVEHIPEMKEIAAKLAHFAKEPTKSEFATAYARESEKYNGCSADECYPGPIEFLDEVERLVTYTEGSKLPKALTTHKGQLKLFMSELSLLLLADPSIKTYLIYAGAAPGNHTGFLSELFPQVRFILVDPNPFSVVGVDPEYLYIRPEIGEPILTVQECAKYAQESLDCANKICIINGYFTEDLAAAFASAIESRNTQAEQYIFVSDIRTEMVKQITGDPMREPDTTDILLNAAFHIAYHHRLKNYVTYSLYKFRHIFGGEDPNVLNSVKDTEPFCSAFKRAEEITGYYLPDLVDSRAIVAPVGKICLQLYPGVSSTETRLLVSKLPGGEPAPFKLYEDVADYEDRLFTYNNIHRQLPHKNPHCEVESRIRPGNKLAMAVGGFCRCNDCAMSAELWSRYKAKYDGITKYSQMSVPQLHFTIIKHTGPGGSLTAGRTNHSTLVGPIPAAILNRFADARIADAELANSSQNVDIDIQTLQKYERVKKIFDKHSQVRAAKDHEKRALRGGRNARGRGRKY